MAIVAHGILSNRFQESVGLIPGYVGSGMAVIGLNLVGHGFGPEGTVEVTERSGTVDRFPAGGRSADLNGDGIISDGEGGVLFSAQLPTGARDTMRQSALDLAQLVRAIRFGMDLDGDGTRDLDANNIHVFAQSLGATPASMLHAIEPGVQTAVLTAGAGSIIEAGRLGSFRPLLQSYFGAREPALLNAGTDFNENLPLRWEPVRINTVPGAIELQDAIDRLEWAETPGAAHSYATHFFTSTLPGVQIKPTLLQFAWGDRRCRTPSTCRCCARRTVGKPRSYTGQTGHAKWCPRCLGTRTRSCSDSIPWPASRSPSQGSSRARGSCSRAEPRCRMRMPRCGRHSSATSSNRRHRLKWNS